MQRVGVSCGRSTVWTISKLNSVGLNMTKLSITSCLLPTADQRENQQPQSSDQSRLHLRGVNVWNIINISSSSSSEVTRRPWPRLKHIVYMHQLVWNMSEWETVLSCQRPLIASCLWASSCFQRAEPSFHVKPRGRSRGTSHSSSFNWRLHVRVSSQHFNLAVASRIGPSVRDGNLIMLSVTN